MKEFMYIFRNTKEAEAMYANLSPAEMEADMKKWNAWMGGLAQQDKLIGGQPLLPGGKVLRTTSRKVTDGPYIEGKDMVGGYVLIKAKDYAEAIDLSKGCPMFDAPEASVEVREIMPIPQG